MFPRCKTFNAHRYETPERVFVFVISQFPFTNAYGVSHSLVDFHVLVIECFCACLTPLIIGNVAPADEAANLQP